MPLAALLARRNVCQCETFLLRRSTNGLLRMNGVRKPFGQPRNIVGPQVRRMRCKAELSQPALAAQCQRIGWDVGRDAIAKIEGRTRWVADSELIHLAKALSSPLTDLFTSASRRAAKGK